MSGSRTHQRQNQISLPKNLLFGLDSLFDGISTFMGYLMPKQFYYTTHSCRDNKVLTFPKAISLKVNVIAWLQFELT